MLYISRRDAVLDRTLGAFFWNLPQEVTEGTSYRELRSNLESFAWSRDESETIRSQVRGGGGKGRSHYRCILSFEREASNEIVRRMVGEWMKETFPLACACAFVHRNTKQLHVHVWIDARGMDGKKLDFSSREWKQIGARWDRIYSREIERQDRLTSKFEEIGRKVSREEGSNARAVDRDVFRGEKAKTPAADPSQREQAIITCAEARRGAVREVEGLRTDIEVFLERERDRLRGHR